MAKYKPLDIDVEHLQRLKREINKVRCWFTGYHAGSNTSMIAGEDGLRQTEILLQEIINGGSK